MGKMACMRNKPIRCFLGTALFEFVAATTIRSSTLTLVYNRFPLTVISSGSKTGGIGRIKRLFAEILSYEIRAWTSRWSFRRQNPAFSVRQRSHSRLVFHRFLERCTQQAHLILPCCGKSLVKEIEWWFRAGTAPPDPAVPSLHGPGVRVAIPSAPDVVESFLSLRGLRCTRPP